METIMKKMRSGQRDEERAQQEKDAQKEQSKKGRTKLQQVGARQTNKITGHLFAGKASTVSTVAASSSAASAPTAMEVESLRPHPPCSLLKEQRVLSPPVDDEVNGTPCSWKAASKIFVWKDEDGGSDGFTSPHFKCFRPCSTNDIRNVPVKVFEVPGGLTRSDFTGFGITPVSGKQAVAVMRRGGCMYRGRISHISAFEILCRASSKPEALKRGFCPWEERGGVKDHDVDVAAFKSLDIDPKRKVAPVDPSARDLESEFWTRDVEKLSTAGQVVVQRAHHEHTRKKDLNAVYTLAAYPSAAYLVNDLFSSCDGGASLVDYISKMAGSSALKAEDAKSLNLSDMTRHRGLYALHVSSSDQEGTARLAKRLEGDEQAGRFFSQNVVKIGVYGGRGGEDRLKDYMTKTNQAVQERVRDMACSLNVPLEWKLWPLLFLRESTTMDFGQRHEGIETFAILACGGLPAHPGNSMYGSPATGQGYFSDPAAARRAVQVWYEKVDGKRVKHEEGGASKKLQVWYEKVDGKRVKHEEGGASKKCQNLGSGPQPGSTPNNLAGRKTSAALAAARTLVAEGAFKLCPEHGKVGRGCDFYEFEGFVELHGSGEAVIGTKPCSTNSGGCHKNCMPCDKNGKVLLENKYNEAHRVVEDRCRKAAKKRGVPL